MVKIRLQRRGRRKKPFYHIVIADARSPRDGRFIEKVGTYNPMTKPATIDLDRDLAFEWLLKGAQPTDTVRAILRNRGVMYRKHLHRGVLKGALTQEKADKLYEDYVSKKDAAYAERVAETRKEEAEARRAVAGVAPPPPPPPVDYTVIQPDEPAEGTDAAAAEAAPADPAGDALAQARAQVSADQTPDSGDTEREGPDAQTPEPAAPGDLPEEVAEAKAPAAENAEAEGDAGGEPDLQSAVDTAANNAEGSPSEADPAATAEAEAPEPEAETAEEKPA